MKISLADLKIFGFLSWFVYYEAKNWLLDSIEDILILKKPWVILHYDTNEHFQSSVLTRNPLFKHQHGSLRIEEIQNLFKKILECGHKMIGIQV